jgi:hypothetical protein
MAQDVAGIEVTEEVVAEECSMSQGVYEKLTADLPVCRLSHYTWLIL